MKWRILLVGILALVLSPGCTPETPATPPTGESTTPVTPQETEDPDASLPPGEAPTPSAPTAPPEETSPPTTPAPGPSSSPATAPSLPPLSAFHKGMNFGDWALFGPPTLPAGQTPAKPPPPRRELYEAAATDQSLRALAATGTNWITLLVRGGQETHQSTDVSLNPSATASDESLRRTIGMAHALGMRVALNPQVHLSRDSTHWHGHIGTAFTSEEQWQAWFTSYRQFIIHYATLAQDAGADMFFIGNELAGTVHREADWRAIARDVRQFYKGPIVYEATVGAAAPSSSEELRTKWWDAVDYIGVLGYFPLTTRNDPNVEDLKSAWVNKGYVAVLEGLSQKYQRPVIITEIGYLSADGTNTDPANFLRFARSPLDLQEQADCYQAALEVFWGKPWLAGIYWWQWFVNPNELGNIGDHVKNETPQGKPAEDVVKKYYLSP